jgi:precorrin-2/cobalt-factor-2 C20-methyltransferase
MARGEAMVKPVFFGLGIGPGDIELMTLKAARILNEADVIAYPAANGGESLARRIVGPLIPEHTTELVLPLPMSRQREPGRQAYDEGAAQIRDHLAAGRTVAFLCEGDPFFYGSFMYMFERLAQDFPTEVVPGVTSMTACAAAIGRPLAARNDVLKIIPGPLAEERIRAELQTADAAAIIKVGAHFDKLRAILRDMGLEARAQVIERATQGDQKITPLSDVPQGEHPYFSTILIYKGGESW